MNKVRHFVLSLVALLGVLMLLQGCKPSIPSDYIQPDDMEDILYDYQLAQAMGSQIGEHGQVPDDVERNVYKMAVLKKHGITQQQFDTSLEYYLRHTEELHKIYENLAERLSKEAVSMGASVNDYNQFGSAMQGDTANVWNKASAFILSPDDYLNQLSFSIKADTAFHKGDKLMLNFDTQYIIQDGSRDAIAMLVVKYDNDSIVTQNTRVTTTSHYSVTVGNQGRLGIKEVRGFFILNRGETDSRTTLKLLNIYNVQLIRMHTQEPEASTPNGDSLRSTGAPAAPSSPSGPPQRVGAPMQLNKPTTVR